MSNRPRLPRLLSLYAGLVIFSTATHVSSAAILGRNAPAAGLTPERIATLPAEQQQVWRDYLARSEKQRQADQRFLAEEAKAHADGKSLVPAEGHGSASIPLNKPAAWYGTAAARELADAIVSFQTPAGGWSKNIDLTRGPRQPGEPFAHPNTSRFATSSDNDAPHDADWTYVGTFDNDATTTELRFLARVADANGGDASAPYRTALLRGLEYILAAQLPNGGWPQVWPLDGGYHDVITFNDNAMVNVLRVLRVATDEEKGLYAFVPDELRRRCSVALRSGIDCILATQIKVNGRRTVWCQQHDLFTLQPTSARNYEMPAQCSSESASLMIFLMELPDPSPAILSSVHPAAAWFRKTALHDFKYEATATGHRLVPAPGAGPLWPRYAEIGTDRPIFGDRDKTIHDTVEEISRERRDGYQWFNEAPKSALEKYDRWSKSHPAAE